MKRLLETDKDKQIILIRFLIGAVFLSEGIQKILFPETLGGGRFETIGLPAADFLGLFVGIIEISCGFFILIGLYSRLACLPLLIIIGTAIMVTKSGIYTEKGIWELLHAARTDWAMLLGCIFILIKGSGFYSVDYNVFKNEIATL